MLHYVIALLLQSAIVLTRFVQQLSAVVQFTSALTDRKESRKMTRQEMMQHVTVTKADAHVQLFAAEYASLEYRTNFAIDAKLAVDMFSVSAEQKAAHKRCFKQYDAEVTAFSACRVKTAQNFKIDKALEEFHTLSEVCAISECTLARVRRHIKTLESDYSLTCKRVVSSTNRTKFKFELID